MRDPLKHSSHLDYRLPNSPAPQISIQWTPLAPPDSHSSGSSQRCLDGPGCSSVVECGPSVFEALSWILRTATTKIQWAWWLSKALSAQAWPPGFDPGTPSDRSCLWHASSPPYAHDTTLTREIFHCCLLL